MPMSYSPSVGQSRPMTLEAQTRCRAGRPRLHSSSTEARRAANCRRKVKLQGDGLVQRSVWLPKDLWDALRNIRQANERSDAATLERILRTALR